MTKTIYKITGYDADENETLTVRTDAFRPDADIEALRIYIRGRYATWVATGAATGRAADDARESILDEESRTVRFEFTTRNEEIREIRKSLGLTQKAMAEKIGITRDHLATMEGGKADVTDRTFAQIFGMRNREKNA